MKNNAIDSMLASIGRKAAVFFAFFINAISTMLGLLQVFGAIDVQGLPLNHWVMSVEMFFVQASEVFDKETHVL